MDGKVYRAGWSDACWGFGYRILDWPKEYRASYAAGYNDYHAANPGQEHIWP